MYEIFARLCKEKGVSSYAVSQATGISQAVLSAWKKRNGQLSAKNTKVLADYFGVTPDYLITGDESLRTSGLQIDEGDEDLRKTVLVLAYIKQLNEEGFNEALKRVEELTYIPKYRKEN